MPARRPPARTFNAERFAEAISSNQAEIYRQFETKLDAVIDKVDSIKSSLQQDIKIVQQDVRIEGQERKALAVELNHVADELGKVRDSIALQKVEDARAAVREVVPAMQSAVQRGSVKLKRPQWVAIALIAATFVVTLAEKAPPTLRFIEKTWQTWAKVDK
jgi:hypothetical protein